MKFLQKLSKITETPEIANPLGLLVYLIKVVLIVIVTWFAIGIVLSLG